MLPIPRSIFAAGFAVLAAVASADSLHRPFTYEHAFDESPSHLWALNVGGEAFQSPHGWSYLSDDCSIESTSVCGELDSVVGSQERAVFASFREGPQTYRLKVGEGSFAVTLYFAERGETKTRTFDIKLGEEHSISAFNIPKNRDGMTQAALARTFPGIASTDGELLIRLEGADEPLLSAILVERETEQAPSGPLRWADEFNGSELDPRYWSLDLWPARKVNDEDQAYVADPSAVRVENGRLILQAHKVEGKTAKYHSGRVHSLGKLDFMYGRVDVRAKLPKGQGVWPAIWLLPTHPYRYATLCDARVSDWQGNGNCDAWPNSGEIDLMEHVGFEPGIVHGTVHTKGYFWVHGNQRKGSVKVDGLGDRFHVYSLEWGPDFIDMRVDGVRYFRYTREGDDWRQWPFDHSFHLIMNLAVGGMWGRSGGPIDDSIFPQALEIDYVRVYEQSALAP